MPFFIVWCCVRNTAAAAKLTKIVHNCSVCCFLSLSFLIQLPLLQVCLCCLHLSPDHSLHSLQALVLCHSLSLSHSPLISFVLFFGLFIVALPINQINEPSQPADRLRQTRERENKKIMANGEDEGKGRERERKREWWRWWKEGRKLLMITI